MRTHKSIFIMALAAACSMTVATLAEEKAEKVATTQPTTQPAQKAEKAETIYALVLEVEGDVQYAAIDSKEWKPVKQDDKLSPLTQIRTGLRSSVKLQIGEEKPYTAVVIESAGKVILSEAMKTEKTKKVRIGVGYGKVRAGVAEGGLQSDFTIDSPVATLSKRGTWNFGLSYTRGTDEFEIFLIDYGLVDAFNKINKERRAVLPGELVRETMRRWADQAQMLRNVAIPDILGQGDIEVAFNRLRSSGLGVTNPGGGNTIFINLRGINAQRQFGNLATQALQTATVVQPIINNGGTSEPTTYRPEGFFGTGRGDELISVLIDSNSSLATKGFAKPGAYKFRRAVLEAWLKNRRK